MSRQQPTVREKLPPPRVDIRKLREAYGINIPALVERIAAEGVQVTADHISNCELGWKRPSNPLLHAWAKALRITVLDITLDDPTNEVIAAVSA